MNNNKLQKNISKWTEKELGEVANFFNGKAHENDISDDGKYIVINSKFVSTNGLIAKYTNTPLTPLKKGDIAMVMSDLPNGKALAKCFLINEDNRYSLNQRIGGFRTNEINSSFLYFLLNRNRYFLAFDDGVNQTNLRKDDILDCPLYFPSLLEQNRIVSVLETWDKAIENLNKKIEIKKQIKKGLMQDLLTGKKRLSGFKDKWETVTLGDVSDFINGFIFKSATYTDDGIYKIITIANVQDGFMFIDEPKLIKELPINISEEQILKKGDILISMTGNVGRVCVVDADNCLLNQRVGKIVPKNINEDLLYLFLHDRRFLNRMIGSAQGGAQGNLSTGDIKEYNFDIPKSKEEQNAIAEILTTADKEITKLEKKLQITKDQKKYLLNNLITGTIRTPEKLSTNSIK